MAISDVNFKLSGLARRLVQDGLLTNALALQAYEQSLSSQVPFVTYLVESRILSSQAIANAASQEFGVPLFDLNSMDLELAVSVKVDSKLVRQHHTLPLFKRGNRLFVAVSDPTNLRALDEIKFHVGLNTEAVLVEEDKLTKTIDKVLGGAAGGLGDLDGTDGLENVA
ncbi:MAG TPA: type IV-A pilus assembly ATPase PilB, partial [Gammaproteobacteria bacterium]|nr:type IV-A pilus assembly ATPase PilB [Gammaproteobacteria bacterium]